MKRFIRTKDGKIIDIKVCSIEELDKIILDKTILKQADTIEELIKVGDVVGVKCDKKTFRFEIDYEWRKQMIIERSVLLELYTKQGRHYVLVAEKIDGEWRVI